MELLGRLWRGEVSLGKTFWFYGFIVWGILCILILLAVLIFLQILTWMGAPWVVARYSLMLLILGPAYDIFINCALWRRCGQYTGWIGWSILTRLQVIHRFGFYICLLFFIVLSFVNPKGFKRLGSWLEALQGHPEAIRGRFYEGSSDKNEISRSQLPGSRQGSIEISGIMMGDVPFAIVNDSVVRVGNIINDYEVLEINVRSVKFRDKNGKTLVREMRE